MGEFGRHLIVPSPPAVSRFLTTDFACLGGWLRVQASGRSASGVVEDEPASVSGINFRGFPYRAGGLVPESGRFGRGFVIVRRDPSADGLPWWVDGFEG